MSHYYSLFFFFFFNDTATTEIYTLSLHDALPISDGVAFEQGACLGIPGITAHRAVHAAGPVAGRTDRKSTRLNSSHSQNSYAVFCLKKKKKTHLRDTMYMLVRALLEHLDAHASSI